ncbi:mucin-2-like [Chironomus tepperi]|uniref:mucin-2-like n=1 Tax=Chironomus tepperi TaxID=113505 RepID=UPI00391F64AA
MLKLLLIIPILQVICISANSEVQKATQQESPWLVYFEVKNKRCGGAMIDDYHVLTAAHCFDSIKTSEYAVLRKLREAIKIRIGEWKTETDPDCGEDVSDEICDTTADIFPKQVIIHEKYNKRHYDKRYQYDIAIIKLGWPPRRSEVISVLRLAEPERCQEATSGEYWKATGFGGGSKIKKRMEMILLSHEECVKSIDQSHLKKLNADVHVCGRGLSGEKTCKGDAGSPVTNLVEGIPYLQGIVTFTDEDECVETETNTASVFLRVPCFYDWIHSKVPNISHAFIEKPEPKPSSNEDTGSIEVITVGESTTARPLGTTLGNRRKPEPVTTTTPRPRSTTRPTTPRTTTRSTTTSRRVVTTPAVVTEADEGNGQDGNDQDENGEGGNGGDGNTEDGNGEDGQDEQGSQEPDTTAKVTPKTTPRSTSRSTSRTTSRTTQNQASTRPWRKPTTSKPKTTTTVEPTVESTTEDESIHFKDPSKTDGSSELDVRVAADNTEDEIEEVTSTTTTAKPPSRGRTQKYVKPTARSKYSDDY